MERHRRLRSVAHRLYPIPGVRKGTRAIVRSLIQGTGLPLKNKQRLYNFVAEDTVTGTIIAETSLPNDKHSAVKTKLKLKLDLHDDLSRKWYYWGYAGYETATTRLFYKLLQSKACVLDVGSNVGYYALLAAAVLQNRGEVHAFEPFPAAFRYLSINAMLNTFTNLHLNAMAVSDFDGNARLFLPSDHAWTNASLVEGFTDQSESIDIPTTRLDTYCRLKSIRQVDLLRIDVEGAESQVLRGMGDLLEIWRPDIICEVLPPYEAELNRFFAAQPYRKFLIRDKGLEEVSIMHADPAQRDYYLSCSPIV